MAEDGGQRTEAVNRGRGACLIKQGYFNVFDLKKKGKY